MMDDTRTALEEIGRTLQAAAYRFIAVTPATHQRILARGGLGTTLEEIFGWNKPFKPGVLDHALMTALREAGLLSEDGGIYRAKVRFATVGDLFFAHAGFPTSAQDAVFFGPDSYRFADLIEAALADVAADGPLRLVDIGCGSGVGGIVASRLLAPGSEIALSDINQVALDFAKANAALAGIPVTTVLSDVLKAVDETPDIVIANPPYLVDAEERLYRHGGGGLGTDLAVRILNEALDRLKPGGRVVLYTGSPIVAGADVFFQSIQTMLQLKASLFRYRELDPDVFGEELDKPAYGKVDRIAVVGVTAVKRG